MNSFDFCFISKEIPSEPRPCSSSDIHMARTYGNDVQDVCVCVCVHICLYVYDCHHNYM